MSAIRSPYVEAPYSSMRKLTVRGARVSSEPSGRYGLGFGFERCRIRDDDGVLVRSNQTARGQPSKRPVHRLTRCAHHPAQLFLRQRDADRDAVVSAGSVFLRQIAQTPRYPCRDVLDESLLERTGRPVQARRGQPQQLLGDCGTVPDDLAEQRHGDRHDVGLPDRAGLDRRRPFEQRALAEHVARSKKRHNALAAVRRQGRQPNRARRHQVERLADISLARDHVAVFESPGTAGPRSTANVVAKGHRRDAIPCHRHSRTAASERLVAVGSGRGEETKVGRRERDALAQVPLFAGLPPRHLKRLSDLTEERRFMEGAKVVRQGDSGDAFFVILEGEAKVLGPSGRVLSRLFPGEYFGEISLLDGGPRTATVVAETHLTTLTLSRSSFLKTVRGEPAVAVRLLNHAASMLRRLERPAAG